MCSARYLPSVGIRILGLWRTGFIGSPQCASPSTGNSSLCGSAPEEWLCVCELSHGLSVELEASDRDDAGLVSLAFASSALNRGRKFAGSTTAESDCRSPKSLRCSARYLPSVLPASCSLSCFLLVSRRAEK